ncbi:MAG: hypothetical protein ABTD50_19395 [Polyangiaceae bacterium]|jgi:hypothetical protein
MTTRFVKGKARTESPRLKDLPTSITVALPSDGRGAHGEFGPGNGAAIGRGVKQLCREGLEGLTSGVDDGLARDALTMYRALVRSLPSDGPGVRQLVASQARHAVMATTYANAAAGVGLASPEGVKLAEKSRAHDLVAQRLAVTAFDLATRLADSRPQETPSEKKRKELAAQRQASPKPQPAPQTEQEESCPPTDLLS